MAILLNFLNEMHLSTMTLLTWVSLTKLNLGIKNGQANHMRGCT